MKIDDFTGSKIVIFKFAETASEKIVLQQKIFYMNREEYFD